MPDFGQPTGYAQLTVGGTAVKLSTVVPRTDGPGGTGDVKANIAVIRTTTQGIRLRQDGTAPTSSVGYPINTGDTQGFALIGIGAIMNAQIIAQTPSATVDILFYSGGKLN